MTNEAERRRWNDARWTAAWPAREALTTAVTPELLAACPAGPGRRVLDVGCGGGGLSTALAARVGPSGSVVGVDISEDLVGLAERRAVDQGVANVDFLELDMQVDLVGGDPFDLAVSQFGVMFFDEPTVAFTNIGRHLIPGGALVFACWQSVERNPWHIRTALAGLVPTPPAPAPGKWPTGPFTLGDPARPAGLLRDIGFEDITVVPHELTVVTPASAVVDAGQLELMDVPPDHDEAVAAIIERHLAQFDQGDGRYAFPLAFQIVTATRP
jgi:SAM-dependent methyltransferase